MHTATRLAVMSVAAATLAALAAPAVVQAEIELFFSDASILPVDETTLDIGLSLAATDTEGTAAVTDYDFAATIAPVGAGLSLVDLTNDGPDALIANFTSVTIADDFGSGLAVSDVLDTAIPLGGDVASNNYTVLGDVILRYEVGSGSDSNFTIDFTGTELRNGDVVLPLGSSALSLVVPEPSGVALLAAGSLLLVRRRR